MGGSFSCEGAGLNMFEHNEMVPLEGLLSQNQISVPLDASDMAGPTEESTAFTSAGLNVPRHFTPSTATFLTSKGQSNANFTSTATSSGLAMGKTDGRN